jgi:hypothetical protein
MKVSSDRRGSPTHDTDVKSFVPDLKRRHEFYRKDFRHLQRQNCSMYLTENNAILKPVLVTTKERSMVRHW